MFFQRLFASRKKPYLPGDKHWEEHQFDLAGNILSFKLPPCTDLGLTGEGFDRKVDFYRRDLYHEYDEKNPQPEYAKGCSSYTKFFSKGFRLFGKPWEEFDLATVRVTFNICRVNQLPESMSCWDPQHFQQVLKHHRYFSYGPGSSIDANPYITPINNVVNRVIGNVNWCSFETRKDLSEYDEYNETEKSNYNYELGTPLDNQYFLLIKFNIFGFLPEESSYHITHKIIDRILSSIDLDLSNLAREQNNKCGESIAPHHSSSFDSDTWQYHKWKFGNIHEGEDSIVLTEHGSPPPTFIS